MEGAVCSGTGANSLPLGVQVATSFFTFTVLHHH